MAKKIALTSSVTGKTFEGLPVDVYPNKLVPYTEDEQIAFALGCGGNLPCDWIPRPKLKRRAANRETRL